MNIFVGSLPFSIEEADLRESFEAYGAVDSVKIITDKFTGRSKGLVSLKCLMMKRLKKQLTN